MMRTISVFLFLFAVCGAAETVLLEESFEQPLGKAWHGSSFGGGPGAVGRVVEGAYRGNGALRLYKETKPGGTQFFAPEIPCAGIPAVRVEFFYHGTKGALTVNYFIRNGKTLIPQKTPLGKQAGVWINLPPSETWTRFQKTIEIPEFYRPEHAAFQLCFRRAGEETPGELVVDDLRVTALRNKSGKSMDHGRKTIVIPLPGPLSPDRKSAYAPIPVPPERMFTLKDGLIYRGSRPWFWIGDGSGMAAGQSTAGSIWMARVLGSRFSSLAVGRKPLGRVQGDVLTIAPGDAEAEASYSFVRELLRNGIYTESSVGEEADYRNNMKHLRPDWPGLDRLLLTGNHYYSYDTATLPGRRVKDAWRRSVFRYIGDTPFFGMELYRELGYSPSHDRAIRSFREWAKRKYGNDLALANRIWKQNFTAWDKVLSPHLKRDGIISRAEQYALKQKCEREHPELYLDWMAFCQEELAQILKNERDDFRHHSKVNVGVDLRAHSARTDDGYASSDPELIDRFADIFFMHRGYIPFDYGSMPADADSVNRSTVSNLMANNFFKTNTKHPVWNSECIVRMTVPPGSAQEFMRKNDIASLHGAWKFKLVPQNDTADRSAPGLDDSAWESMQVPGCWDKTEAFQGRKGTAWYRKRFEVPRSLHNDFDDGSRRFLLYGRGIAQSGTIWLNGRKVGEVKGWDTYYRFDVGGLLNYGGENLLAIRVDGDGYYNGLRFFCHLLANDMINEQKKFGEKQYVSLLWTSMMRGLSAVSLWNWSEEWRPFMPRLDAELNSVSQIVLPEVRKNRSRAAFLYPYLYTKGLVFEVENDYNDYMSYYNAFEFRQVRPDVFGERNFRSVAPEQYPVAVFPYGGVVRDETFRHFKEYVNRGGTAVVTFGSLERTFSRYEKTELEKLAGIRVLGESRADSLTVNGTVYPVQPGDFTKSRGVRIRTEGATVLHRFPDGSPAVTECKVGKGRIRFIAPRLDLSGVTAVLQDVIPEAEVKIVSAEKREFPYIESWIGGRGGRAVLYLHNWGGLKHELTVTVPGRYASWRMKNVRGEFRKLGDCVYRIVLESNSPAALLLEEPGTGPLSVPVLSPALDRILSRLSELRRDGDGSRPAVLFLKSPSPNAEPYGRGLLPVLADVLDRLGYETRELPAAEWTPELAKQFPLAVLAEDCNLYHPLFGKGSTFAGRVAGYVRNGGSLLLLTYTAPTLNAQMRLLRNIGPEFGVSVGGTTVYDRSHAAFGDPLQFFSVNFADHPVTSGVQRLLVYASRPLSLKQGSPLKGVVFSNAGAERRGGEVLAAAGKIGKGRVLVTSDLLWLQPFRVEHGDNLRFLLNSLGWLLRKEIPGEFRKRYAETLFLSEKTLPLD